MDELDCHELPRTNRTFPDVDGQCRRKSRSPRTLSNRNFQTGQREKLAYLDRYGTEGIRRTWR